LRTGGPSTAPVANWGAWRHLGREKQRPAGPNGQGPLKKLEVFEIEGNPNESPQTKGQNRFQKNEAAARKDLYPTIKVRETSNEKGRKTIHITSECAAILTLKNRENPLFTETGGTRGGSFKGYGEGRAHQKKKKIGNLRRGRQSREKKKTAGKLLNMDASAVGYLRKEAGETKVDGIKPKLYETAAITPGWRPGGQKENDEGRVPKREQGVVREARERDPATNDETPKMERTPPGHEVPLGAGKKRTANDFEGDKTSDRERQPTVQKSSGRKEQDAKGFFWGNGPKQTNKEPPKIVTRKKKRTGG